MDNHLKLTDEKLAWVLDLFESGSGNIYRARNEIIPALYELQQLRKSSDEVKGLLKESVDSLHWLLNLIQGNSKGGPEFNPPSEGEWEEAFELGKSIHENTQKLLGGK